MRVLFVLFVLLPIAEIAVLIQVGSIIGTWNTVALVIFTAILGGFLLRKQGEMTLSRAQLKMQQGTMPAGEMVEGLFLAVGGALLLTPGFITDTIGLACLIPGLRKHIIGWGARHLTSFTVLRSSQSSSYTSSADRTHSSRPQAGNTIDGEYRRED